jgi:uncharacterized protein
VEDTIRGLIERQLASQLPRRPGQREERYGQLLGRAAEEADIGVDRPREETAEPATASAAAPTERPVTQADADGLEQRVTRLEEELGSLRADLRALREELGA